MRYATPLQKEVAMPFERKTYGKTEASKCYEMLRRFRDQFKEEANSYDRAGKYDQAEVMYGRSEDVQQAMVALVKHYDL